MKRAILFFISFIVFIVFLIMVFQNIGYNSYSVYTNILIAQSQLTPGGIMIVGFVMGAISTAFMVFFILGGGNVRITTGKSETNKGNLEWE